VSVAAAACLAPPDEQRDCHNYGPSRISRNELGRHFQAGLSEQTKGSLRVVQLVAVVARMSLVFWSIITAGGCRGASGDEARVAGSCCNGRSCSSKSTLVFLLIHIIPCKPGKMSDEISGEKLI